jgi:hypothetical protein
VKQRANEAHTSLLIDNALSFQRQWQLWLSQNKKKIAKNTSQSLSALIDDKSRVFTVNLQWIFFLLPLTSESAKPHRLTRRPEKRARRRERKHKTLDFVLLAGSSGGFASE